MKAVIVGTSGHIDHGKSALVKALTGTDPDRLEEEKRRGITIDLGFASLELAGPGGEPVRVGLVDVPGHERFVRNMLAGIGGIDLVLLVIAADESIKPQTREHFDICRLLNVKRGITVITKSDLVDAETLEVVRMELAEYLAGSFLDPAHAPLVAVSSKTGAGLDQLKFELSRLAQEVTARDSAAVFRLPIDRVFSMKGFGTVVTGTLLSGAVHKEQAVQVHPSEKLLRVRGIQVHGSQTDQATAGQRTALNLAGADTSELSRGMVLTIPYAFKPARRMLVKLDLLPPAKPLRDRARVHLHAFTAETIAEVSLLGTKQLLPGNSAFARLNLSDPLMVLPDDRFIVRQFSPVITIGGGRVLDTFEHFPKRTKVEERIRYLQVLESGSPLEKLKQRILRRMIHGLPMPDAIAETGWPAEQVQRISADLQDSGEVVRLGDVFIANTSVNSAMSQMRAAIEEFHQANPLATGINKEQLREKLQLGRAVFDAILARLVNGHELEGSGEEVRAKGRNVVFRDDEAESKLQIEEVFIKAGLKVPLLSEVLASLPIDRVRAQKIMTLLLRNKVLVKLADDLVFHQSALQALRQQLAREKASRPKLNVADFKNLTGVTRKHAIPLLEYLDREHVTRRLGDERVIL